MVQDSRWPALPLLALRGIQLLFAIMALGMSGYLISADKDSLEAVLIASQDTIQGIFRTELTEWGFAMTLAVTVLTLIYVGINFALFFMGQLLPLAVVIVDALLTIFWVVALGGLGATKILPVACSYTLTFPLLRLQKTYESAPCRVVKAAFGISLLIFLSFLGTLALALVILYQNRRDLGGADGDSPPQPAVSVAMGNVHGPTANTYYQEPKQDYYHPVVPTPQPTATPVYYDYQHPVVSPPATPAPYMQSRGMPPPPPQGMPQHPPAAAEMPER